MTTALCSAPASPPGPGPAGASSAPAVNLIQFPPGSITANPVTPSAFFRRRGRVIRGMPETSSLPWAARILAAKASKSSTMSGTTTRQLPYESSGRKPGMPKKCRWRSSRSITTYGFGRSWR